MHKNVSALLLVSALAVGLGACAEEHRPLPEGTYERTSSSTDANGTTTERTSSTEVDVDDNGHRKTVIKSKTTEDPKGLFNKTTTSQSEQVIENTQ